MDVDQVDEWIAPYAWFARTGSAAIVATRNASRDIGSLDRQPRHENWFIAALAERAFDKIPQHPNI